MKNNLNKTSCCGGYFNTATHRSKEKVFPNGHITGGTRLIYIGDGTIKLNGRETGTIYYLSNYQRHLKVYPQDVNGMLRRKDIILEP